MREIHNHETNPMLGRVVRSPGAGRKVFLVSPARVVNDEAEGADLIYEHDGSTVVPVTIMSSATPAAGDLIVGVPVSPGLVSVVSGKPISATFKVQVCVYVGGCAANYGVDFPGATVSIWYTFVKDVILDDPGSGYRDGVNYGFTSFGGFTGDPSGIGLTGGKIAYGQYDVVNGSVTNIRILGHGSGFDIEPDIIGFDFAGPGVGARAHSVLDRKFIGRSTTASSIWKVEATNQKTNGPYTNIPPNVKADPPPAGGMTPILSAVMAGGALQTIALDAGGMDFLAPPAVTAAGNSTGATRAAITAIMGVGGVTIASRGSYGTQGTYDLVVENSVTTGTAGTYTIGADGGLDSVSITVPGRYHARPPNLLFPSGGINGARAVARLTIVDLTMNQGGLIHGGALYYDPIIKFLPDLGARAHADAGPIRVSGVLVTFGGNGYKVAPAITIDPPEGGGETATATSNLFEYGCFPLDDNSTVYRMEVEGLPPGNDHWKLSGRSFSAGGIFGGFGRHYLAPEDGYGCFPDLCATQTRDKPPYQIKAYPGTLHADDGKGSFDLNFAPFDPSLAGSPPSPHVGRWHGLVSRTAKVGKSDCMGGKFVYNFNVNVYFVLQCYGFGYWYLDASVKMCPSGDIIPGGYASVDEAAGIYGSVSGGIGGITFGVNVHVDPDNFFLQSNFNSISIDKNLYTYDDIVTISA